MSVLIQRRPWRTDNEPCVDSFFEHDEYFALLSSQMISMNKTLTVYSSYAYNPMCKFNYPNIIVEHFDAMNLLQIYNFTELIPIMSQWHYIGYERAADIFRILLAHKYKKTYIDSDVHFLDTIEINSYFHNFVGSAMWSEEKNAIEITNSAFCLSSNILEDMIYFIKNRIKKRNDNYFYTELGPSMFHKIILNKYPVLLYSQNHPAEYNIHTIISDIKKYKHNHLHLTGKIIYIYIHIYIYIYIHIYIYTYIYIYIYVYI
jgi:hypothetical protein